MMVLNGVLLTTVQHKSTHKYRKGSNMSTAPNYSYTVEAIDTGFEVKVYDGLMPEPFYLQPFNPENNNLEWASEAEAAAWAQKQIDLCIERDNAPQKPVLDPVKLMEQAVADSERIARLEDMINKLVVKLGA